MMHARCQCPEPSTTRNGLREFFFFFFFFLQADYKSDKWRSREFPYQCIESQPRRYLGILLLRVLDVSSHFHRHPQKRHAEACG